MFFLPIICFVFFMVLRCFLCKHNKMTEEEAAEILQNATRRKLSTRLKSPPHYKNTKFMKLNLSIPKYEDLNNNRSKSAPSTPVTKTKKE